MPGNKYIKSKLFDTIQYEEKREIEDVDKGVSVLVNDYTLFNKDVEISVGKQKHKGVGDKMVAYFPIYLVSGDKVKSQIGIFEILAKDVLSPKYMDDDGDLNMDSDLEPILYSFVNKSFLNKYEKEEVPKDVELKSVSKDLLTKDLVKDEDLDLDEELDKDDVTQLRIGSKSTKEVNSLEKEYSSKSKSDVFEIDPNFTETASIKEETKTDADKMQAEYVVSHDNSWIEEFMKNNNYKVVDNEGGGDCFFAVIRDAFAKIGYKTSVKLLRETVANDVGETQMNNYQEMYFAFIGELADLDKKMRDIAESTKEYKKRVRKAVDKEDKRILIESANKNAEEFKKYSIEKRMLEEDLKNYRFMKEVASLEDFKAAIMKSTYWADEMAISILEKKLNIKMIILSEENFKAGDKSAVMKCISGYGSEEDAVKNPQFYIIASHTGDHYKLITYKNVAIFKFREIPYSIKILIVNKCIEKNAGTFNQISNFRDFQNKLGIHIDDRAATDEADYLNEYSEFYNADTVFQFYNKSANKPPGKGNGEKIDEKNINGFSDLRKIPEWRRMLDDEYNTTFRVDNKRWQSVEHYYQGSKFKKGFPDYYMMFSLDSESDISKDVEKAKAAGGKSGKQGKTQIRPKNVVVDPEFFDGRHKKEREKAILAKFEQNENLRRVLLNTKNAKLIHYESGREAEPDNILMQVRKGLK
jgi:predicted NAD-dependent protein-ADP-ribosyltransferase YbiA (DUF1768 family)